LGIDPFGFEEAKGVKEEADHTVLGDEIQGHDGH
jgi:hypothetical protein